AAGSEANAALDAAFAQRTGFNLNALADRYEQEWLHRMQLALDVAEAARHAAVAAQLVNQQAAGNLEALERRVLETVETLQQQLTTSQERVRALENSTWWRLGAPIRWAREQKPVQLVRQLARLVRAMLGRAAR